MRCPQCNAEVLKVGNFWICPEHGQLPPAPSDPQAKPEAEVKPVKRRIFLSYGHDEHATLAVQLKQDLEKRGHKVWFDLDRLKPGGDWEMYIEEGLRWTGQDSNGCALLLMTPHSVRRPDGYCLNEVARAVERGLFTLPVMVVQVEPPLSIARLQWFDMTDCVPLDGAGPRYEDRREVLISALESGKVDFEGAQARLLHWLKPIEFSPDILHHLQHFHGREWVRDEIHQWLEKPAGHPKARVFWITGAPGVGKTALSIWLASKAVPEIKAWHLCQYNHDINKDPQRCVASIVCYLSRLLPDYFEKLKTVDLESTAGMSANTLFSEILVKPLSSIAPPSKPVVILIDALDEAMQSDGKNELANFIGSEFHKTPEWLRLIVTSRPVPEVETPLSRFDPWRLDTMDPRNFSDIEEFVRQRLRPMASGDVQLQAAVRAIVERSEGVFLYAWYVCDEITAGRLDIAHPDRFPKGLTAVYLSFFQRQFPDPKEYETLFAPVFEMMAAARDPLTLADFQENFQWTGRQKKRFREGIGAIFRIRGEDGAIEPFHKSAMEWLTCDAPKNYYVDAEDGARALAEWGWRDFREKGPTNMPPYFLRHLPTHLAVEQRWDELEALLTDLAFLEAKVAAGMTFELPGDFGRAIAALPPERPARRIVKLLDEAIRRDLHFIARHAKDYPQALFQCVWNHGWWYDCDEAAKHYEGGVAPGRLPSHAAGGEGVGDGNGGTGGRGGNDGAGSGRVPGRLCALLERWRAERERAAPEFAWVRSRRPPPTHLGTALRAVLRGHDNNVYNVAFSPNGRWIVSGSKDKTLRVWDAESGAERAVLRGHQGPVKSVAFSPNGRWIVSGSKDKTLRVWDAESGAEVAVLRGHEDWVLSVAFSPDGQRIVSGSDDKTLRVWDAESGAEVAVLRGHEKGVGSVAFNPDGQRIVSGSDNIRVWDANSGEEIFVIYGPQSIIENIAFSPDGRRIVSGLRDSTVRVWDTESKAEHVVLRGHKGSVNSVAYSPDGRRIVSGSFDKTLRVWDAESGAEVAVLRGHEGWVNSVAFSPDGRRIISGSGEYGGNDNTVRVWDAKSIAEQAILRGHEKRVTSIVFCPDGRWIVSGSEDETLRMWDTKSGVENIILRGHGDVVNSIAFSPEGGRIASGSRDNTVRVWNTESGDECAVMRGHKDRVWSVAFSPDGRRIVSGSFDGTVRVWDAEAGAPLAILRGHACELSSVAFSPDGQRIVSGSNDNTVRIWDAAKGNKHAILRGHTSNVWSVAFSPDGRCIASGSDDETVRLWDTESGEEHVVLRGHKNWVRKVTFSLDGRRVISSSRDNTIRMWDAESGECLKVIEGWGDVDAIAAGAAAFPWRALGRENEQETVIERSETGKGVARFPCLFWRITTHPSGHVWTGVEFSSNHLYLISLEGPAS